MKFKVLKVVLFLLVVFQPKMLSAEQLNKALNTYSVEAYTEESINEDDVFEPNETISYTYIINNLGIYADTVRVQFTGFKDNELYLNNSVHDIVVKVVGTRVNTETDLFKLTVGGGVDFIMDPDSSLSITFEVKGAPEFQLTTQEMMTNTVFVESIKHDTVGDDFYLIQKNYQTSFTSNNTNAFEKTNYSATIKNNSKITGSPNLKLDVSDTDFQHTNLKNPSNVDVNVTNPDGSLKVIKLSELIAGYEVGELKQNQIFKLNYDVTTDDGYIPPVESNTQLTSKMDFSDAPLSSSYFKPSNNYTINNGYDIDGFKLKNSLVSNINGTVQPNEEMTFELEVSNLSQNTKEANIKNIQPELIDIDSVVVSDDNSNVICSSENMSLCSGDFSAGFKFDVKGGSKFKVRYIQKAPAQIVGSYYINEASINDEIDSTQDNIVVLKVGLANFKVSKSANVSEIKIGDQIDYTIDVLNTNPNTNGSIIIKDELTDESFNTVVGNEVVNVITDGVASKHTIAELKSGIELNVVNSVNISFSIETTNDTEIGDNKISNTVNATSKDASIDQNTDDDTVDVNLIASNFSIDSKVDKTKNVIYNDKLTFEIDVTNNSNNIDDVNVLSDFSDVGLSNAVIEVIEVQNALEHIITKDKISLKIDKLQTSKIVLEIQLNLKDIASELSYAGEINPYFILDDKGSNGDMCSSDSQLNCITTNDIEYIIDRDLDGLNDWIEDVNGNGVFDVDGIETNLKIADTDYDLINDGPGIDPENPKKVDLCPLQKPKVDADKDGCEDL